MYRQKKKFLYAFANDLCRLLRLFYITSEDSNGQRDFIVEFPKSKLEVVLQELRRCKIGREPRSYPEYLSSRKNPRPEQTCTTNHFEALADLDDSDDAFGEVIESSLDLDIEDLATAPEDGTDLESETGDWILVARRKAGKKSWNKKRKTIPCKFGIHCSAALDCCYLHTDQEKKMFRVHSHIKFKFWKTRLCSKLEDHSTWPAERQAQCQYAHTPEDSWCLRCAMYGHLTDDCKVD